MILTCGFAQAQNLVRGRVIDSLTRESIPSVHVFFANTSIGSPTALDGSFEIKDFGNGRYDLIASMVGYNTWGKPLTFDNQRYEITIVLFQKPIELNEVLVKADTNGWYGNYQVFKKNFLGETHNSLSCKINNSSDLRLFYDARDRVLVGHASRPLEIENRALGYKLYFILETFEVDYAQNRTVYLGVPRFENLTPKSNSEARRWEKERVRAYYGSFTHLLNAVRSDQLEQSGFLVYPIYKIPNRNRPSEEYIQAGLRRARERIRGTGSQNVIVINGQGQDSLSYFARLRAMPVMVDSLGAQIKDADQLIDPADPHVIRYTGWLRILYTGEREEIRYAQRRQRASQKYQESLVYINENGIRMYANGNYSDVRDVLLDGYIGWGDKISDTLPLEYALPVKKN
jgi:hypothetical protein